MWLLDTAPAQQVTPETDAMKVSKEKTNSFTEMIKYYYVILTTHIVIMHSFVCADECNQRCLHGTCQGDSCVCHFGWEGPNCDEGIVCSCQDVGQLFS